ncbi:poly-gamma-glutamate biosynthesis protein PgsC/CapC [Zhongshania sp.]|uniref:poly-gamma-glutamate biosynthesis protein PgsC/CapC n=1 Tax=Zhongshania sp. TaxID=1971902 RepID=UPI0035680F6F
MIELFPENIISESVVITVWVGVAVVTFFNLRFGTTMSGLVIPGYIVPLIIVKPSIAVAIMIEGVATYVLVRLLADKGPRWLGLSEMFGRDRFFVLVLGSIFVRILFDTLILPEFAFQLEAIGLRYDLRDNLHSFGLIIVALIANQMWNGGARLGLASLSIYLLITWFIVRYVLMEFTNFNLSTLGYMYEDIASSIFAAPKAYIILLTTAFIASRMNLRYGWDFNGILLPSLLALQWFTPLKLIATFAETLMILGLAHLVLQIPFIKNRNIEGARQILVFFTIALAYKWLLGFVVQIYYPAAKISDYYAFGYLLSSLLAVKMYQTGKVVLVSRATLQVSFLGVAVATAIGYGLNQLPSSNRFISVDVEPQAIQISSESLQSYLAIARAELFSSESSQLVHSPLLLELERFRESFEMLNDYLQGSEQHSLEKIAANFNILSYRLEVLDEGYFVLRDMEPERGWGLYVFRANSVSPLVFEVPAALDEVQAADAASVLFDKMHSRAIAFAGTRRKKALDGGGDVLRNANTVFQVFHQVFGRQQVVQIRGYDIESARKFGGIKVKRGWLGRHGDQPSLWVAGQLPKDLNLRMLKLLSNDLILHWQSSGLENRQRETATLQFAELFLDHSSALAAYKLLGFDDSLEVINATKRIDGYLQESLYENKGMIAKRGTDEYKKPELHELLFFDQAVLTPIYGLLNGVRNDGWDKDADAIVARVSTLAEHFGYQLIRYHHLSSDENYLILSERGEPYRHWGTYVFRVGGGNNYLLEISRPIYEANTFEYGISLFEQLRARTLLIAGTHPAANSDGSADISLREHKESLFNLVHTVSLRESPDPAHVVQIRAFSPGKREFPTDADVLVAHLGASHGYGATPLEQGLLAQLRQSGLRFAEVKGERATLGFEASWNAQSSYMPMLADATFDTVWLAPQVRRQFRNTRDNYQLQWKFAAAGIDAIELGLADWLRATPMALADDLSPRLLAWVNDFVETENINNLFNIGDQLGRQRIQRLVDRNTGQSYLLLLNQAGEPILLANLAPLGDSIWYVPATTSLSQSRAQEFIDLRVRLLQAGPG